MKYCIPRIIVAVASIFFFIHIMTYIPQNSQIQVVQNEKSIRVPVKIVKPDFPNSISENEVEPEFETELKTENNIEEDKITDIETNNIEEETIKESVKESIEENTTTDEQSVIPYIPYIDSFIDIESFENSEFTEPVLDLDKIFSKMVYPPSMRKKNIEASFKLRIFIDNTGKISLSFPDGVEQAFRNAVEKSFKGISAVPAKYNNRDVDVTFTVPINFVLK